MFEISKEFAFCAAHQLHGLPEGHKCGRLHGHNYRVVMVLASQTLDEYSFVVDYGDLKPVKDWIDDKLDHRNLNDVFHVPTTAENLAQQLFAFWRVRYPQLTEVRVSETPKTWATYRPG